MKQIWTDIFWPFKKMNNNTYNRLIFAFQTQTKSSDKVKNILNYYIDREQ